MSMVADIDFLSLYLLVFIFFFIFISLVELKIDHEQYHRPISTSDPLHQSINLPLACVWVSPFWSGLSKHYVSYKLRVAVSAFVITLLFSDVLEHLITPFFKPFQEQLFSYIYIRLIFLYSLGWGLVVFTSTSWWLWREFFLSGSLSSPFVATPLPITLLICALTY